MLPSLREPQRAKDARPPMTYPNGPRSTARSAWATTAVTMGALLSSQTAFAQDDAAREASERSQEASGYAAPAPAAEAEGAAAAPAAPAAPAAAAPATGSGATATTQLSEVTVTSDRSPENVQDVAASATVIPHEKIEALNTSGQDIRSLSGNTPSLYVESSNGRTLPRFYIRGYGNTDFSIFASQPVGLVYDGIQQSNPTLKSFPMFDLANVEVMRGPQGALYGRNTPAGVVKLESVKPSLDDESGYFQTSWGRYNTINVETAYNKPLTDSLAVRVSLLEEHRDDWIDNTYTGQDDALGSYDDRAYRVQFLYKPDSAFRALLNAHGRILDGTARVFHANAYEQGRSGLAPGIEADKTATDGRNDQDLSTFGSSLDLSYKDGDLTYHSVTGYESVINYFSRGDIDGGNPTNTPFSVETGSKINNLDQISQEFRVESDYDGRLNWQAGLYYFYEDVTGTNYDYDTLAGGEQTDALTSEQTTQSGAAFGGITYDLTDKLTFSGGVRYTYNDKKFDVRRIENLDILGPRHEDTDADKVSWDVSLKYQWTDQFMTYGRVATGFRAPSFAAPDASLPITVADSEDIISYELGFKSEYWDHRIRTNADIYYYNVDGQQLTANGGQRNITTLLNADKTTGYGAEVDIDAYLTSRLMVTLNGSYNHTELKDNSLYSAGCGAACTVTDPMASNGLYSLNGNPLPRAPEFIGTISARYDWPLSNGRGIYLYTDWSYRDEFNIFLYDAREFRAESLIQGGARLGYTWDNEKYEVAVFCRNCTDEIEGNGAIDFNNLTGFVNDPRIWGAQFRMRF
ncbi:TonB-dependent receptor [Salinisphaera sp. SPP-AMP-43]|uniref:TonB-dependent receptor n=1 Tax=Salinisphaera sp. SPP-AMP-43 TaxID=3121288 RepID=UPI003C6DFE16